MKIKNIVAILVLIFSYNLSSAQQNLDIYLSKTVEGTYEEVCTKVEDVLKKQGFGVITEIDMDLKLKEKLENVDMKGYKILGVCNPSYAYETLKIEENIGVFLPCKAIIRDLGDNKAEVVMVNPSTLMGMLGKAELTKIANEVTDKFKEALKQL